MGYPVFQAIRYCSFWETGFYYLQSRYYDPIIKRFINTDAAEYSVITALSLSETNLFAYCRNNPILYSDDDGELAHVVGAAVVGAALSAGAEVLAQAIIGEGFDIEAIIVEAVGGALFGAIATCTGSTRVAEIASVGVKSVLSDCIAGETVRTTLVNAVSDMAIAAITDKAMSLGINWIRSVAPRGSFIYSQLYQGKHIDTASIQTRYVDSITASTIDFSTNALGSLGSLIVNTSQSTTAPKGTKGVDYWMKYYS